MKMGFSAASSLGSEAMQNRHRETRRSAGVANRVGAGEAGDRATPILFYRDTTRISNGVENVGYSLPQVLQDAGFRVHRYPHVTAKGLQPVPLATLARRLRRDPPRLLHLNWIPTKLDWTLLHAFRVTRCPTTVFIHGDLGAEMEWNHNTSRPARAALFRWVRFQQHATKVIVASKFMQKRLASSYGISSDAVAVIPNGITVSNFRPAPRVARGADGFLLYVGGLWRMKGVDTLIRAMGRLKNSYPQLRLKIVGGGAELRALAQLAHSINVGDRVVFCGSVEITQLREMYSQALALILPSRSEAFGIVLLEAMASGLPIVAARAGGIPELVKDGESGLLFRSGNSDELRDVIEELITRPELGHRLALSGLQTARLYDWSLIGTRYSALFHELIERGA